MLLYAHMNMRTLILLILAIIIIGTIYITYTINSEKSEEPSSLNQVSTHTIQNQDTMEVVPMEETNGGNYAEYSEELVQMVAADDIALLFFHAAWCPTCRTLDTALQNAEQNNEIPAHITVFKTNFDSEKS